MTVWVDNMRMPARVGRVSGRWSHLTASTPEELNAFAARIGLRRSWFQAQCKRAVNCPVVNEVCPHYHYDVTDSKREEAIAAGAVAIEMRAFGEITSQRRREFRAWLAANDGPVQEQSGSHG